LAVQFPVRGTAFPRPSAEKYITSGNRVPGGVGEPARNEESTVLGEHSFIEDEKEFAAVRPEALNRMWVASREEPEIAFRDVADKNSTVRIENRHPGISVQYVGHSLAVCQCNSR